MGTFVFSYNSGISQTGLPIHIGSGAQEPGGAAPGTSQPLYVCGYNPLRSREVTVTWTGDS